MRASPSLAVDRSTSLGRRIFTLLTRAHVPHVHSWSPSLAFTRALLVNPSATSVRAGAITGELCCVLEVDAFKRQFAASSQVASKVAWLAHGPTMEDLMPRVRLALERGRFLSSAPDRAAAYVAEDDLALMAAASLASEKNPVGFHLVSGPQNLTHEQVVSVAREAFGRPGEQRIELEYVPISKLEEALRGLGLSDDEAHAAWLADGLLLRNDLPASNDTFARLTGLTPLSFRRHLQLQRNDLDGVAPASKSRLVPLVREPQPADVLGVSA